MKPIHSCLECLLSLSFAVRRSRCEIVYREILYVLVETVAAYTNGMSHGWNFFFALIFFKHLCTNMVLVPTTPTNTKRMKFKEECVQATSEKRQHKR